MNIPQIRAGAFAILTIGALCLSPASLEAQYDYPHPVVDSIEIFATGVGAPSGLAIAEDGTLLIGDFHNPGFVRRATMDGTVTLFADGIRSATNILVHPSGRVFVTSQDNTIEYTGPDGGELLEFTSGFNNPSGLAGDHLGNMYVVNNAANAVTRVNADGQISPFATGFNDPVAMTSDECGNLYVADRGTDRVLMVDAMGVIDTYEDSINAPHSLAFDRDGNLFVSGTSGITVVTPFHDTYLLPGTANNPTGMAFDAAGRLYVSSLDSGYVTRITLKSVGGMVDTSFTFAAGFSQPSSLLMQPNGDLLVANFWNPGIISRVTPAGAVSEFANGESRAVTGLARDSAGYIYGCHQDGTVKRVGPGGGTLQTFIPDQANPSGLAIHPDGSLYVVNHNISAVKVYTPSGEFIKTITAGMYGPVGCILDPVGNLLVANRFTGSVEKITPGGAVETFVSGVPSPHSLAFDASGNLFVSIEGAVVMVTPAGVVRPVIDGLSLPTGLAFDSDGNLYVANFGDGTVTKVVFR